MTDEEKLEILKWKNPFTSSSVGDPREGTYPDVPSINEHAFNGLYQIIEQKTQNPALSCAGLILGEVGSGKTHLIGKILEYSKQAQLAPDVPALAFAYVQPIEDPEQTYRYLLREVVVNLCYPIDKTFPVAPLERIVDEIFREVIQRYGSLKDKQSDFLKERTPIFKYIVPTRVEAVQNRALGLLTQVYPEVSTSLLKVLFQYWIPEKRAAALNWLKGNILDHRDAALLQVPDRFQVTSAVLEQEARDILISLGFLLARYRQTLIICFDRLENLETDEQVHAFGKMLELLVDKVKAMFPIACFRAGEWERRFRLKLNQHVTTRLETNQFELRGCTANQALTIIRNRLTSVLGENQTDPFFPFDREELIKTFKKYLYPPRMVILEANKRLRRILHEGPATQASVFQILQEEFENQCQSILRDLDHYQPDRERLRRALELYLLYGPIGTGTSVGSKKQEGRSKRQEARRDMSRSRSGKLQSSETTSPGIELIKPSDDKEKYIDFIITVQSPDTAPISVAVIIDIEQHPSSVSAGLSKGIEFLKSEPFGKVFYIRDTRSPIPPNWKATNEKLQLFKDLGGSVILLDVKQAARWYALTLLSYAVKEGDITLLDEEGRIRPITSEEFAAFVQEEIYSKKDSAFQDFDTVVVKPPEEKGSPSFNQTDPIPEAEKNLKALVQALDTLKLPVEPMGYIVGPRFIRCKINPKLDQGVTVKKLVNQAENLQIALSLQGAPLIQPQAGYVSIDIPRKSRIPLTLGEVWQKGERNRPQSKIAFPIGMAIDGSVVWIDLTDPTMTSVLIGGTSGSGKSILLRTIAISLALNANPSEVQLTLIDPKRVSFTDLTALPHLSGPILMEASLVMEKLKYLVEEMEERYYLLEQKGTPDINIYNQTNEPLNHQVIIIDEYADLMIDKETRLDLELSIQRLGQKGRAAGMHLILATQRPDARVITPIIKANLQLKVALKVINAANSTIILDTTGAEYLIGHGDMLIGGSVPLQRLQGPLVTKTEIEMAIQNR